MANLLPNINEYSDTFRTCLKNREDLVNTLNYLDYEYPLSEAEDRQPNSIITYIFLEKRENLGWKCTNLLLKQVWFQYQLLKHINSSELQILLDKFRLDAGDLEHDVSSFPETSTRLEPINVNCLSLVNFADKSLPLIIEELQNHQKNCGQDSCVRCYLLDDEEIDVPEPTPLLQNFGSDLDEVHNKETDTTDNQDLANPRANSEPLDLSFNIQVSTLHEEYSYERFKKIVLKKYKDLEQYYKENVLKDMKTPVVILYTDKKGIVKVVNCATVREAKIKANSLADMPDLFPVVLIATADYRIPSVVSRKKTVRKNNFNSSCSGGKVETPSIPGTLETPTGREFSLPAFYIDTGADTGSVGYDYDIIKHFVLTVLNINGAREPAILCIFKSAKITDEEIQIFDVDQDPNWNAIGLSILKNYVMYTDIKNGIVLIEKREEVTVDERGETIKVTFMKDNSNESQIDWIPEVGV